MHASPSPWFARLRTIAALLVVALAGAAAGQGLPFLADPVDTDRLREYAEALELSPAQQIGLEPVHDAYLARFARLRDGEIKRFQDRLLEVGTTFMSSQYRIPERDVLEDLLDRYRDVLDRICAVDRTLFADLQSLLTEAQGQRLERLRCERAVAVRGQVTLEMIEDLNRAASVNLSELLDEIDLAADERARLDPLRAGYATQLLAAVRDMEKALEEAAVYALDTIDEKGFREMTMPELMELGRDAELIAEMQARFDEGSKPVQAAAWALSQLNLRTFRSVLPLLAAPRVEALRDRFHRHGYPEAWRSTPVWRDHYDRARALPDVAEDVREQVILARADFARQEDQIVDAVVNLLEEARKYQTSARLSRMEPDPARERIAELNERRHALGVQADRALEALLGPETVAALDGQPAPSIDEPAAAAAVAMERRGGGPPPPVGPDPAELVPRVDELPRPLTSAQRQVIERRLELTDDQRAFVQALHRDYLAEWTTVIERLPDEEDEDTGGRRRALEAAWTTLAGLDSKLFDEIALAMPDNDGGALLAGLRHARALATGHEVARRLGARGDAESTTDLADLVYASALSTETVARLNAALSEYATTMRPLVEQRLELARSGHRRGQALRRLRGSDRAGADELARTIETKWREARETVAAKSREISAANRSWLDRLAADLGEPAGRQLRSTYNRAVHADVYRTAVSMEAAFDAALALPDLAPHQRERVSEIAAEFRDGYDRLALRLIDFRRRRTPFGGMPTIAQIEREIEMERMEFEQHELGARARFRLELTLTPEQLAMLSVARPGRRR